MTDEKPSSSQPDLMTAQAVRLVKAAAELQDISYNLAGSVPAFVPRELFLMATALEDLAVDLKAHDEVTPEKRRKNARH